ncbi:MAG: hypothetical protein AAF790_12620, partial [Planctomycetota bacterium]
KLVRVGGNAVATRADAIAALAAASPGDPLDLTVQRAGDPISLRVVLAELDLSPGLAGGAAEGPEQPVECGNSELAVPGSERIARVRAPKNASTRLPVVVWLARAGGGGPAPGPLAEAGVVVVESTLPAGQPSVQAEKAYLADLLTQVRNRGDADAGRIVLAGSSDAAPAALLLADALSDRLAGVVAVDWPARGRPRLSPNVPDERLGVMVVGAGGRAQRVATAARDQGYPVYRLDAVGGNGAAAAGIAAWLAGLDRF